MVAAGKRPIMHLQKTEQCSIVLCHWKRLDGRELQTCRKRSGRRTRTTPSKALSGCWQCKGQALVSLMIDPLFACDQECTLPSEWSCTSFPGRSCRYLITSSQDESELCRAHFTAKWQDLAHHHILISDRVDSQANKQAIKPPRFHESSRSASCTLRGCRDVAILVTQPLRHRPLILCPGRLLQILNG